MTTDREFTVCYYGPPLTEGHIDRILDLIDDEDHAIDVWFDGTPEAIDRMTANGGSE